MPLAQVDDAPTNFFYRDSGVPMVQDRPYTTIVAVHGLGWNSREDPKHALVYSHHVLGCHRPDIFSRLLPLATASHVRLVILNRRGYYGSTPFAEDEIADIDPAAAAERDGPHAGPTRLDCEHYLTFMQQRGAEIARFLAWFIDNEQIPPRCHDKSGANGGISLLGWALGNTTTLSLLALANTLDPGLVKKLQRHLRKVVVFDASHHALGYRTPENAYNPLFDLNIPAARRQSRFATWISSYFDHPEPSLDLVSPRDLLHGLELQSPNHLVQSTQASVSPADIRVGYENVTPAHADPFSLVERARPVHEQIRLCAIFGDLNGTSVPPAFPNVGISYIVCTESVWESILAARSLKAEMAAPPPSHYPARSVAFFELEGNHYAHWDHPLRTFAAFAAAIE